MRSSVVISLLFICCTVPAFAYPTKAIPDISCTHNKGRPSESTFVINGHLKEAPMVSFVSDNGYFTDESGKIGRYSINAGIGYNPVKWGVQTDKSVWLPTRFYVTINDMGAGDKPVEVLNSSMDAKALSTVKFSGAATLSNGVKVSVECESIKNN